MTEASSRPTRPKQITPKELRTKRGLAGILKSAAVMVVPKRDQITYAKADQDSSGNECTDGAEVVDPLADAQANDVQHGEQREQDAAT